MKKFFYSTLVLCGLMMMTTMASCKSEETEKWEYKTVAFTGTLLYQNPQTDDERNVNSATTPTFDQQQIQNTLTNEGNQGWELVNTLPFEDTSFPNFGDAKYVPGIKPNTHTSAFIMFFKRKKAEKK